MITHRQVRATFVLAALIAVAAILSVVLNGHRAVEAPVEIGVVTPEPVVADTAPSCDEVTPVVKKKRPRKSADDAPDHHDSPLYHAAPRDDLR